MGVRYKEEGLYYNSFPNIIRKKNSFNNLKLYYNMTSYIETDSMYLQCFVWKLLVSPLFELNVHSGVKGTRIHGLGSRKVDVLNNMGGNTFPELLLQNSFPARTEGEK